MGTEVIAIIVLSSLLVLSLVVNGILFWFTRGILRQLNTASHISTSFFVRFSAYLEHLESIFSLKIYKHDETIRSLVDHTREMTEFLKDHVELTSFMRPEVEQFLQEVTEEEDDRNEEKDEAQKEIERLLYENARERNNRIYNIR